MRRFLITMLILIINIILQSTLFNLIRIHSIIPNTALVVVVSMALLRGSIEGCLTGLGAGLLQDIFFGSSLGYYAVFGMVLGYLAGKFNHGFYKENYLLPVMLCFFSTVIYESMIFLTGPFFYGYLNYPYFFINLILPEAVYTAVLAIAIYRILFSVNEHIEKKEKYKRKLFSIKK
ncbi:MAG: rod shape-determining protein MreD [Clostridia bacterium]|nr:rod shape-determining protein MreD [Clostridia bacterium]